MPKLPTVTTLFKKVPSQAQGAWRVWSLFKSLNVSDIAEAAEKPFQIVLIGAEDQTNLLMARLALETAAPRDLGPSGPADIRTYVHTAATEEDASLGSLRLDAESLTASETGLAVTLAEIVRAHPELRLSLARHVPAFRPAVVTQLINDASKENAKLALLSALPGVIPVTDFLLPATALGDMVLLTKNQGLLLLSIAAAYGRDVDLRARTRELLPVVGSAFGWRAAARQLVGPRPRRHRPRGQRRNGICRNVHGRPGGGGVLQHRPCAVRPAPRTALQRCTAGRFCAGSLAAKAPIDRAAQKRVY